MRNHSRLYVYHASTIIIAEAAIRCCGLCLSRCYKLNSSHLKFINLFFFSCNRQLQDKFVSLLRLLLLWDPKRRGGLVLDNGKRECFDMLEKIVNTVVINLDI